MSSWMCAFNIKLEKTVSSTSFKQKSIDHVQYGTIYISQQFKGVWALDSDRPEIVYQLRTYLFHGTENPD